jgi:hypothetical protein
VITPFGGTGTVGTTNLHNCLEARLAWSVAGVPLQPPRHHLRLRIKCSRPPTPSPRSPPSPNQSGHILPWSLCHDGFVVSLFLDGLCSTKLVVSLGKARPSRYSNTWCLAIRSTVSLRSTHDLLNLLFGTFSQQTGYIVYPKTLFEWLFELDHVKWLMENHI